MGLAIAYGRSGGACSLYVTNCFMFPGPEYVSWAIKGILLPEAVQAYHYCKTEVNLNVSDRT